MKCPLCGCEFKEGEGLAACQGCPLAGACNMIRCPNCGYDIPKEPRLIRALKAWRRGKHGANRES
jgi:hypothetical protein